MYVTLVIPWTDKPRFYTQTHPHTHDNDKSIQLANSHVNTDLIQIRDLGVFMINDLHFWNTDKFYKDICKLKSIFTHERVCLVAVMVTQDGLSYK